MSDIVPSADIERIVGATRHETDHIARAVSREQRVYLLHPHACLREHTDLRDCLFSLALDEGIDLFVWVEDVPMTVLIADDGQGLVPA